MPGLEKLKWVYGFIRRLTSVIIEAAKRYDLDVLTKEEKLIKKFPLLSKRINKLEDEIAKIKVEQVKLRGKK